jgi:hypothetical protein
MSEENPSLQWTHEKAREWLCKNFYLADDKWIANLNVFESNENTFFDDYKSMIVEGILHLYTNASYQVENAIFEHLKVVCDDQIHWNEKVQVLQSVLDEKGDIGYAFFALMDKLNLTTQNGFMTTIWSKDVFELMTACRVFEKAISQSN